MNKAILIGRLTKDPDSRVTQNGTAVCTFTLAVDRRFKDSNGEKQTDFIQIVAWRKTAELCGKYLHKGSQAAISGEIQTRSYEAKDGGKRYVTEIVADEVQFLGGKPTSAQDGGQVGFTEIDEDDLPF